MRVVEPAIRLLSLIILVLFCALVVMSIINTRKERQEYTVLLKSNPWIAWQIEREYYRFYNSLQSLSITWSENQHQEVILRFEILLSRLPLILEGSESQILRQIPGATNFAEAMMRDLLLSRTIFSPCPRAITPSFVESTSF
jgi:hypothetical protein